MHPSCRAARLTCVGRFQPARLHRGILRPAACTHAVHAVASSRRALRTGVGMCGRDQSHNIETIVEIVCHSAPLILLDVRTGAQPLSHMLLIGQPSLQRNAHKVIHRAWRGHASAWGDLRARTVGTRVHNTHSNFQSAWSRRRCCCRTSCLLDMLRPF